MGVKFCPIRLVALFGVGGLRRAENTTNIWAKIHIIRKWKVLIALSIIKQSKQWNIDGPHSKAFGQLQQILYYPFS